MIRSSTLALLLVLACVSSGRAQVPADSCWPGQPEIENRNPATHAPVKFPDSLSHARTKRSVIALKLCVSETGRVARVLVLEGSGNPQVDRFLVQELRKQRYTPVKRGTRAVPSVVKTSISLYLR